MHSHVLKHCLGESRRYADPEPALEVGPCRLYLRPNLVHTKFGPVPTFLNIQGRTPADFVPTEIGQLLISHNNGSWACTRSDAYPHARTTIYPHPRTDVYVHVVPDDIRMPF